MIAAQGIHKSYGNIEVLKGVSCTIQQGEIISIVGPSGAGKSTLLQIIGTLDRPDKDDSGRYMGTVSIDGIHPNRLSSKKLSAFRNQMIGFIFQFHHLLPEFTAFENVCIPGYIAKSPKKVVESKAKELLDKMGLGSRTTHYPSEMSGGEQQRVAVARSLINNPSVVLADEPSGNLDSSSADDLHNLFFELRQEFKQTFVVVTHNQGLAEMTDRKLTIIDGKIIENS